MYAVSRHGHFVRHGLKLTADVVRYCNYSLIL